MPIDIASSHSSTSSSASSPVRIGKGEEETAAEPAVGTGSRQHDAKDTVSVRTQELCGLFVGYAFSLQYVRGSHLFWVYDWHLTV
jgi:hypothetical protein